MVSYYTTLMHIYCAFASYYGRHGILVYIIYLMRADKL
jgi:hypothetical protein